MPVRSSAMDVPNPEKLHLMDYRLCTRIRNSPYTWHRIIKIVVIQREIKLVPIKDMGLDQPTATKINPINATATPNIRTGKTGSCCTFIPKTAPIGTLSWRKAAT